MRGTAIRRAVSAAVLALVVVMVSGCARSEPCCEETAGSAQLFFGGPRGIDSTAFGRGEWPATTGRYESVEDTVFVEYYRDFYGNAFTERNTPMRYFRSYRVGVQQR